MKRIISLVIALLIIVGSSTIVFNEHNHVHAATACPNCGSTNISVRMEQLPMCTTIGSREYYCADCYQSFVETLDALGHDYDTRIIRQATCTESGLKELICIRGDDTHTETIPALGHSYTSTVTKNATCTETGIKTNTCSRCGDSYTETIAALGHNYKSKVTKQATCEESGITTYTCTRCNKSYTKTVDALGHDFEYEETEATCLEDGHKIGTCKRCGEQTDEVTPALGHDISEYTTNKEATCTEDGVKEGICSRCGNTVNETIEALGHDYPKDWTIEKEATYLGDGLQSKTCSRCGDKITEVIPKLITQNLAPAIAVGTGGLAAVGGALYVGLSKAGIIGKKVAKTIAKSASGKVIPKFETKTLVTTLEESIFTDLFKKQRYLKVKTCDTSDLDKCIEENEPHIVILDVVSEERFNEVVDILNNKDNKQKYGLIINPEIIENNREILDKLKEDKKLVNYISFKDDAYLALVRLILPILKPELKSDETLENIGNVADALGIPGISTVINVYTNGRDIKETLQEGELGVVEKASIISSIASILGLETLASVVGLVDDVDTIKTALDKESGRHEEVEGMSAAKDVVEVISDIINK